MPTVRPYRAEDWPGFVALDTETGLQTLRYASDADRAAFVARWPTMLQTRFGWGDTGPTVDNGAVYVLDDDQGAYAGHLFVSEREDPLTGRVWLWVTSVAIAGPYRSRGWGRLLMARALEEARVRGIVEVGLDVDADNVVARKLYEEMGFATARLRMHRRTRASWSLPVEAGPTEAPEPEGVAE